MPGVVYDKSSRGAKAYMEFGKELVQRMRREDLKLSSRAGI